MEDNRPTIKLKRPLRWDQYIAIALCPVCAAPVHQDTLVAFCGHDQNAINKCAA